MAQERDQKQKISLVNLFKVDEISLSVLSAEEARKQSVLLIDDSNIYEDSGEVNAKGINSDRLGTMDHDRICKTCQEGQVECPGHFGHIELCRPVFHANLLDYIRKILKAVCFNCSHLLADDKNDSHKFELKNYAEIKNAKSRFKKVQKMSAGIKKCSQCERINHSYKRMTLGIEYQIMDPKEQKPNNDPKQQMLPEDAQKILTKISKEHLELLGLDKEKSDPANMILNVMAVGPPPIRPSVQVVGSITRSDDDLTIIYNSIVKQNNEIKRQLGRANDTAIREMRKQLQYYCAIVMSNNNASAGIKKHKSGQPLKAISERLKGKEGRLRGNCMGKRCDFTARSVITCDPNLRLDQLGVPIEIAKNMTIPEVVTEQNFAQMRTLIDRGAFDWPGAKTIIRTDGRTIDLSAVIHSRTDVHLELGYIVERHLQDNDVVIFNRQPSLHKMSMMGHRIKVLEHQTFRLNLSVTTPYNADFDGDEMNMHVPQSMETKAEIKEIMAVPKQIVAPQSNKPCMGIVQDALLGINRLTSRDTFIEKHVFMNILMFVEYDLDRGLPQPAILKPKPLWSGKQVISLVIPSTINAEYGGGYEKVDHKDTKVVVQKGQLLEGILGKGTVGNAAQSLIHLVWKDIGPQACSDLLSDIQLVVNNWLVNTGFTVGVQDIIAKPEILGKVQAEIQKQKRKVRKVIRSTQLGKLKQQPGKSTIESFEMKINSVLNDARTISGNIVLEALEPTNRLKNMVGAGSKGSDLNISQIMSCCGQQNVEGKRIPFGFNRRTLPHFVKDDFGPESRGFVENSYVSGLTPSEFYFHAMGGREGVIDTAVKTANTGYISRRLMKALEDVMVKYDGTVRTSREILVQFLYGEDGMAGEHFENIVLDLATLSNEDLSKKCDFLHSSDTLDGFKKIEKVLGENFNDTKKILADEQIRVHFNEEFQQLKKDRETLRYQIMIGNNKELEKVIMPVNLSRMIMNVKAIQAEQQYTKLSKADLLYYFQKMKQLQDDLIVVPEARIMKSLMDSKLIRESSENASVLFKICLRRYLCSKNIFIMQSMSRSDFDQLTKLIKEAFDAAIVNPGEMVGSVAANSIGEPATQMTLNTFHNAGISSKNVTLGVPRLNEVINVAKNLKTPSLKIFLDPKISKNEQIVNRIGAKIQYLNLSHIVAEWGIYYDPDPKTTVIEADRDCVELYQNTEEHQYSYDELKPSRWVLRLAISDDPQVQVMFNDDFVFSRDVGELIRKFFPKDQNGRPILEVIYSDDIMLKKVIRIRPYGVDDQTELESIELLREMADQILNQITLRGIKEITKIFTTTSSPADCNYVTYDQQTGKMQTSKENFIIETDGTALFKVLPIEGVDATKTTSNSVYEIFSVLGIEATRQALIYELRFVLSSYGIYVNYRHIATLVDIMTMRGILCSITRHGINRTNCGAIRKCTFEETTEILLEAAFFGERDPLSGISENIIFGQLARYGTGCFDIVMDTKQLDLCIQQTTNNQFMMNSYTYTPIHDNDNQDGGEMTPCPDKTPGIYVAGGGSSYPTSPYDFLRDGMTPQQPWGQSPNPTSAMSPNPYNGGATPSRLPYQSPGYHQTPRTPYYNQGQTSGQYSPTIGNMGLGTPYANYMASYSPTNMNMNQTPVYGSNHYYSGVTPQQQVTPTPRYNYGGVPTSVNASQMPRQQSPSMNPSQSPLVSSMGGGSISNLVGQYSNSNSPSAMQGYASSSTPPYQVHTPSGLNQQFGASTTTPGAGAIAYDPNAIPNPDSSDSDN